MRDAAVASPSVSVVIPVLNEAAHLPSLLNDLHTQQGIDLDILVADGGSTDGSPEIAERAGAVVVRASRGRGAQMNAAAKHARRPLLLFLHADSHLSDPLLLGKAVDALQDRIREAGNGRVAGHFPLRFIRSDNRHALAYRYVEAKTALNRTNTTNGDQGFLMTQEFFEQLGGFSKALPFLEDQEMAERIRQRGVWITLPGVLQSSARRFEAEGFHRRYLLMGMIMGIYSVGAHGFFERAPGLYRSHPETGLLLSPFFRAVRQVMREELGIRGSLRAWYAVGRYIRQNAWQPFFFLDVLARPLLRPERTPLLRLHDRIFRPLTDFAPFDALAALLCFVWYMGVLAPYFALRERSLTASHRDV
jgi:rSAM/selenodomain-associated transferase 2